MNYKLLVPIIALSLISNISFSKGRIQNEDFKTLLELESSVLTTTGNLAAGSPCLSSLGATTGLAIGQYVYDFTHSSYLPSGTTILAIPGTCPLGQYQLSQNSTNTISGDTINFGGSISQLLNDTKVYVTANGLNRQLSTTISDGSLLGALLGSFTSGSILFSDGTSITQDNPNLFWNDSSNRLGIGTSSPVSTLQVNGTATIPTIDSGSGNSLILKSSGTPAATIDSSGNVSIAGGTLGVAGQITAQNLTASRAVFTDASNHLVSNAITGSGNVVMSASPTFSGSVTMPGTGIWNSSGNVGVGTTSPGFKLEVDSSTASADVMAIKSTSTSGYSALDFLDNSGTYKGSIGYGNASVGQATQVSKTYIDSVVDTVFTNGATTYMTIKNGGNVGIGTTSPNYGGWGSAITLQSPTNSGIEISTGAADGTNLTIGGFEFVVPTNTAGNRFEVVMLQGVKVGATANDKGGEFRLYTKPDGATAITERMRVDSSGNVGIGTTSPGAKLDVLRQDTAAGVVAQFGNNNISGGLQVVTDGNLIWGLNAQNSRSITLRTNQTDRFLIDPSGNVGIGTTSPGYEFVVQGQTPGLNRILGKASNLSSIVASGGTATFTLGSQNGYGVFFIVDATNGASGMVHYFFSGGLNILSQSGGSAIFAITASPSSSQIGLQYNSTGSVLTVKNGLASGHQFCITVFGV